MVDYVVGEQGTHEVPKEMKKQEEHQKESRYSLGRVPLLLFILAVLIYLFLFIQSIDGKYVDFGDGNYLYISWRVAEGEILYKDLPSPQPPLLLFWGGLLLWLSGGDPVLIRLWQAVQHVLIACCVVGITNRIFIHSGIAALAGIIYLFLPEGVWWSAGYQSEPLLILLLSFNMLLFLTAIQRRSPSPALNAAALFSVLSCFTNMTALPYVALQWFFVWLRFRGFFIRYTLVMLSAGIAFFLFMMVYSHGQYIEHVFFRQVGTYPTSSFKEMFSYFLNKLNVEGGDILFWEGGFVFSAIAGILLFSGEERKVTGKDYIIWWAIFSLGSIIFVTKGGTVEYIFTLGEPAVAVFSAFFLTTLFMASDFPSKVSDIFRNTLQFGKFTLVLCLLLPALLMKPVILLYQSFTSSKIAFELSAQEMDKLVNFIQYKTPPQKLIIAPPAYAFESKRKLAESASSLFILGHAYFHEWKALKKERNLTLDLPDLQDAFPQNAILPKKLYQTMSELDRLFDLEPEFRQEYPALFNYYQARQESLTYSTQAVYELDQLFEEEPELREKYPVINLFLNLRRDILNKDVRLVLVNKRHFFFYIPPLHQAIRDYCTLVENQPEVRPREEILVFYEIRL